MHIAEALRRSSTAEHISGKASVLVFEDLGFSLLTVKERSFVVQDLEEATAINGVPRDHDQAQAFVADLSREAGISFEQGWMPVSRSHRCRGQAVGVLGMFIALAYLVLHLLNLHGKCRCDWLPSARKG